MSGPKDPIKNEDVTNHGLWNPACLGPRDPHFHWHWLSILLDAPVQEGKWGTNDDIRDWLQGDGAQLKVGRTANACLFDCLVQAAEVHAKYSTLLLGCR